MTRPDRIIFTIPQSGDTSNAKALTAHGLRVLHMPAAFDGATVSFLVSDSLDGTYQPLYWTETAGTETQVALPVTAGRTVVPVGKDAVALSSARYLKIKAVTTQAAARAIVVSSEA